MNIKQFTDNQTEKRDLGIDAFRIVSMMMIVLFHILGHGGILAKAKLFSFHYEIAWLMEIATACAINCYGLISGYIGYGRKFKYANIFYLYLQVLFYLLIITGIFAIFEPETIGLKTVIQSIFPLVHGGYWYFTAYFCMFFFIPFFNLILEKFDKRYLNKLIITILLIYSVLPTLFHSDIGNANNGYSPLWLAILYLLGGYLKKYHIADKFKQWHAVLGYVSCVFISWFVKLIIQLGSLYIFGLSKNGDYLIAYTSPTTLLSAIFLLIFFSKLNINNLCAKIISFFSPISFGVYLIHDNSLIRKKYITQAFDDYLLLNPLYFVFIIIGTALFIWCVSSFIDRIRFTIFDYLKIKEKFKILEKKIDKKIKKYCHIT